MENKMKETEMLELKKSTSELRDGIKSICAILNKHQKGKLIFGVKPSGEVVGQQISEKTIRDISQRIANSIEPKIYPEIYKKIFDGRECVVVKFIGIEPIYYADGKAYLRVGDEDRKISAKEIEKRIFMKSSGKWDSKVSDGVGLENVNGERLKKYIAEGEKSGRISFSYVDKKIVLDKLGLIKENKLLNAGMILFSDKSDLEVQAAVFAGSDKNTFLDMKDKTGNLFDLLEFSENYIKEHINWGADLTTGTRKDVPEIPIRAISEALVNSFCHRDYTAPESNKVAIYKDRVEIWNPGEFPSEFKPMDFVKMELPSILRNPKIAKILYFNKKIEKWGSGIKRIYDECVSSGVRVEFRVLNYGFSVIFYRKEANQEQISAQIRHKSVTNGLLII